MPILTNILRIVSGSGREDKRKQLKFHMPLPFPTALTAVWIGMSIIARQDVTKIIAGWIDPVADLFASTTTNCAYWGTSTFSTWSSSLSSGLGSVKEVVDKLCNEKVTVNVEGDECDGAETGGEEPDINRDIHFRSKRIRKELTEMLRDMDAVQAKHRELNVRQNQRRRNTDPTNGCSPTGPGFPTEYPSDESFNEGHDDVLDLAEGSIDSGYTGSSIEN